MGELRAREVIEFYADRESYEVRVTLNQPGTRQPGVITEGGTKARAFIQRHPKED